MTRQTKIVCPLCAMNRQSSAFERDDEAAYGTWDDGRAIIQIRDAPGGKAHRLNIGTGKYRKTPGVGFPMIDSFTLDEAMNMPEYEKYVGMMTKQLLKVIEIFHNKDLISTEELQKIIGA